MSTEQQLPPATPRPSRVAITKLLVEMEARRKHATQYWRLALLAPLLIGSALLGYTTYAVHTRLERIKDLDRQIAAKEGEIKDKESTIAEMGRVIEKKDQVDVDKNQLISNVYANSNDPEIKKEIINSIEKNDVVAATTPRVYIFYPDPKQDEKAKQLARSIQQRLGYLIPDVKQLKGQPQSEVLYFSAADYAAAEKVRRVLGDQGVDLKIEQHIARKAVLGLIEVWLPPPPRTAAPVPAPPVAKKQPAVQPVTKRTQTRPGRNTNTRPQSTPRNSNRPGSRPPGP